MRPTELLFEDAIEASLVEAGGYGAGNPLTFDRALGLDSAVLLAFVRETQSQEFSKLVRAYGGSEAEAEVGFLKRVAEQIDSLGTLDVLRHGVADRGSTIRVAYFKPAHDLTPVLVERYAANRLTVTRQLAYEVGSNSTLDLALSVNGIPVATAELKNPLTRQSVEHAIRQYREDRDPANVTLSRRALVHFAVDPEEVAMTTRLDGPRTRFLPFNLGSGGGKGNPVNPDGYRTAYLWERVWQRDAWLDLLARFIHVEMPTEGSRQARRENARVIFPRFHQWDAVLRIEAHARAHGAGQSYLVQHSAGSGKSNTIAWLAHRLSSLHSAADAKVFDKVIVITDRVVLDRQLQETIFQFEHTRGVVQRIDEDSAQLAEALAGEQAKIIITTLQKFPFVLGKVADLPSRRYAVIIDEAHSSQTGESAKDLKRVLGMGVDEAEVLAAAEVEDGREERERGDAEDFLARSAAARVRQPNLSFFAFTATPKAKTLELFGTPNSEGKPAPFHLYTMRQAIEEGFILDVLANYTTYAVYSLIEKAVEDDPEFEKPKATRAIARFLTLHPHNLAQKAEIIVEHFRAHTAKEIGGKAKAMVVTSSRLHAVRYKQAIDAYVADKGFTDVHALVAFSGTVNDGGLEFTEPGMNGLPEKQTATAFAEGDYQVLVVAEKFQTGYDQPLLHTMFVDKPLTGLNAVQTLSRLNRIHPEKKSTFVLDFRNTIEDVQEAFKPYYGATVAIPTDPNLLYDARRELDAHDVLREAEMDAAARLLASFGSERDHPRLYALLDPGVDRFNALSEEAQDEFRASLRRFVNVYAFLSQIVSFTDTGLERDYLYCRALATLIPSDPGGVVDLGSEVLLTHLRHEVTFAGDASLGDKSPDGEIQAGFDPTGPGADPEHVKLSELIALINEKFGRQLSDADWLLFDQLEEDWVADSTLADQARANDFANFRLVFDRKFMDTVVARMDSNDKIFEQIIDESDLRDLLADYYVAKVYARLRAV